MGMLAGYMLGQAQTLGDTVLCFSSQSSYITYFPFAWITPRKCKASVSAWHNMSTRFHCQNSRHLGSFGLTVRPHMLSSGVHIGEPCFNPSQEPGNQCKCHWKTDNEKVPRPSWQQASREKLRWFHHCAVLPLNQNISVAPLCIPDTMWESQYENEFFNMDRQATVLVLFRKWDLQQ